MKIVCKELDNYKEITVGTEYDARLSPSGNYYIITNDKGKTCAYPINLFDEVRA